MNVRFLTIAQEELDDAYCWFEERTAGKGLEFLDGVHRAVVLIRNFPLAGAEIEREVRRTLIERFPYAVVYGIEDETIIVIAIAHTRRKPTYWVERLVS